MESAEATVRLVLKQAEFSYDKGFFRVILSGLSISIPVLTDLDIDMSRPTRLYVEIPIALPSQPPVE